MIHPKGMPPVFLTPAEEAAVKQAGHFYARGRQAPRKVSLGGQNGGGWTPPTYYSNGYMAIFNVSGAIWTIEERHFDKATGAQIGETQTRTLRDDIDPRTDLVRREPGTYISIRAPLDITYAIDADKDTGE